MDCANDKSINHCRGVFVLGERHSGGEVMPEARSDMPGGIARTILILRDPTLGISQNDRNFIATLFESLCTERNALERERDELREKKLDEAMQQVLNATDEQIAATLRIEGHDPKDVATIARQATELAILQHDKEAAELALRSRSEEAERLRVALRQITELQPEPFAFPADWCEQVEACAECKRYRDHPIQQGICDTHRMPLYQRAAHDEDEKVRLGYRAKRVAIDALSSKP